MSYTGVKVLSVRDEILARLWGKGTIKLQDLDGPYRWSQNEYVVVKCDDDDSEKTTISVVKGDEIRIIANRGYLTAGGITARNKEQNMALHALSDPTVPVTVLTGRAGTGKTLLTLAAAIEAMESNRYDKVILTRPMTNVGKYSLGALPGDANDKFGPYLENYMCNLEQMMGGKRSRAEQLIERMNMQFVPLQLIRGASWANTFVIADEVQVLDHDEMVALGTRPGENSKLVIMGDLGQRDEKIARDRTGLYYFINHDMTRESGLVASIELLKCERGKIASLFADVFER